MLNIQISSYKIATFYRFEINSSFVIDTTEWYLFLNVIIHYR